MGSSGSSVVDTGERFGFECLTSEKCFGRDQGVLGQRPLTSGVQRTMWLCAYCGSILLSDYVPIVVDLILFQLLRWFNV